VDHGRPRQTTGGEARRQHRWLPPERSHLVVERHHGAVCVRAVLVMRQTGSVVSGAGGAPRRLVV